MKSYVIDASVVLTALLGSRQSVAENFARLLREEQKKKIRLYVLSLTIYEALNGLRFAISDQKLADEIFEKFSNLSLNQFSLSSQQGYEALRLAYKTKTSAYDTAYHMVARLIKGTFLTCDKKYFNRAKHLGNIELFCKFNLC